jgi:hypothetical protein
MKYLFLLYADENGFPAPDSPEAKAQLEAYGAFFNEVDGRGLFQAGDPVQSSSTATTVTVRDGQPENAQGPASPAASRSSASTCSTSRATTRPSSSRRRSPPRRTAASRRGRSWCCPSPSNAGAAHARGAGFLPA